MKYPSQLKQIKNLGLKLVEATQLSDINDNILSKLLEKRKKVYMI